MSKKKKSVPLEAKQAIIKSPLTVPAVPAREFFEFDAYAENGQTLTEWIESINRHDAGEPTWGIGCDADELQEIYDEFDRARKHFERDDQYRTRDEARKTLTGRWSDRELKRQAVAERVGLLLTLIPIVGAAAASTQKKKIVIGMMIEHIIAANPRASMLEATCRKLVETKRFITIAEVMEELRAQAEQWRCLFVWQDEIDRCKTRLTELNAAYEAKQAQEAEEKRLAEEREKERRERWQRERQERLAREQREQEERRQRREQQERERKERRLAQLEKDFADYLRARLLWRWFQLLLWSRGIFVSTEALLRLQQQKETIVKLRHIDADDDTG
jgi:hypothetical protein